MILLFSDWVLSKSQGGLLGYQYDNLTRELVVQGDLPEGWTWDILVSASGNSDTWPLALGDGQASITLTDDNLSVRGEYYLQLRGTNGDQVRHTNIIMAYNSRSLSGAGQWPTLPTEWIQAEKDIKELNAHPPVPGSNGYWLLWDLSSHSYQESDLPVPVGPAGPPNVLEIGTVETLPADQPATASITGESPAQKLNLGIPQGKQGDTGNPGAPGKDGQTPTIAVGTVTTLDPGQDATAEITGETPNLTLNLGIPQGPPGQDGVQINDEAVNTTEAWSSKKIVDTLCPPFTETGNPITCNPVEDYPLDVTVTMEPIQAGSGDPSPKNVRPISGYDEVTVNVRGKNVVDVDDIPDASIGSSGHYYTAVLPIKPYLGVTFTLSANVRCLTESYTGNWQLNLGCGNGNYNKDITNSNDWGAEQGARISVTGTCDEQDAKYQNLAFRLRLQTVTPGVAFEITNIMLEINDTPTSYEPYQPGTTATLTLPETIYGGTVDAATGVGSNETIMFDFAIADMDNTEIFPGWNNVNGIRDVVGDNTNRGILKNEFKISNIANSARSAKGLFNFSTNTNSTNNLVFLPLETWGLTQTQWKEQYPDLVIQLCLNLISPEPFQATGNQPIPAILGENTVYTDGDSLAVSGRQDLLYTLQTMQAQTQNLNRFIAEGGTQ